MKHSIEPTWKRIIDFILMLNVLLVYLGAILLGASLIAQATGNNILMDKFQILWKPLFTPSITLLISASLISGIISWLQRRAPRPDQGTGS